MHPLPPPQKSPVVAQPPNERGAIGVALIIWLLGGGFGLALLVFILLKVF